MPKQSKKDAQPKPKKPQLAREDALDILASAIGYCREAGFVVTCDTILAADGGSSRVIVTIPDAAVSDIGAQALFTVRPPLPVEPVDVRALAGPTFADCPACFGNPHRDDPGRICPECGRTNPEAEAPNGRKAA